MAPSPAPPSGDLATLTSLLRDSRRIIVFTGATQLRSPLKHFGGVTRTALPTWSDLQTKPGALAALWQLTAHHWKDIIDLEPTPLHHAIVELQRMDKLVAALTYCVDGLLRGAGLSEDHLVDLYGSLHEVYCPRCKRSTAAHSVYPRLLGGSLLGSRSPEVKIPRCFYCHGELVPGTNVPGQMIRPDRHYAASKAMARADLLIAAGSDLSDNPAANLCLQAHSMDLPYVIVHDGRTHHDNYIEDGMVTHRLQLDAAESLPRAVAALKESA